MNILCRLVVVVALFAMPACNAALVRSITPSVSAPTRTGVDALATASIPTPSASATPPSGLALAVNAGGPATSYFQADKYWVGYSGANTDKSPVNVSAANAAPAAVYATYRTAPKSLTYNVTGLVPGASYNGFLHFEEPLIAATGGRVQSVSVGGVTVVPALDVFAVAGKTHSAVVIPFSASANASGSLAIVLTAITNNTLISGFEIYSSAQSQSPTHTIRRGFLGTFFRPEETPPYGVFSVSSPQVAPNPYPTPGATLFGPSGYCDRTVNGISISSGYVVDPTKLANVVDLGVEWTRSPAAQFFDDESHVFGAGRYAFGDLDSAQCALQRNGIVPVVGLEAGPVQYNAVPGTFSPSSVPTYKTAADFGTWCGAVATHEHAAFPAVNRYSIPGNEVDSNPSLFPGGVSQIAAYTVACYRAIKAADPSSTVYAFELNMDGSINVPAFVQSLYNLGCGPGTCYDGISLHLTLAFPIPPASATCYPNPGGSYAMACIAAVQQAAHANVHVLISETVIPVPAVVPDGATQAAAVVAEFETYAADPYVDGVSYANVDECALYPTGYFSGGCLVNESNVRLPAYAALAALAEQDYGLESGLSEQLRGTQLAR